MNCHVCKDYGATDYGGFYLEQCEACYGTGKSIIDNLDPKALKAAARALWQQDPNHQSQEFEKLPASRQVELAWDAAKVVFAYQHHNKSQR